MTNLPNTPPPTRTKLTFAGTGLTWVVVRRGCQQVRYHRSTAAPARTLSFEERRPISSLPEDSGRNNVYEVTVKVTDSKGNSDEQDVTVKVTNVEEPGMVTLSTLQPRVDFPVTATLADAGQHNCGQRLLAVVQGHCDAGRVGDSG